jgi:DNA-binding SARP family transcriptional activator
MLAVLRGEPAVVLLDEAVERLRFLGADVLELWARARLAAALAPSDAAAALETARKAAEDARRVGAHGAVVAAQVAASLASSGPESASWTQRAVATANQYGLPVPIPEEPAIPPPATADAGADAAIPSPPPPLSLRLFGGFAMDVNGEAVDLGNVKPRARAALRLLALHAPRPVHREVLCAALWPEADADAATRNLQVAVSSLRQVLEPGAGRGAHTLLVRDGDAYRLALPEGAVVDLAQLREHLAAGRLALAAGRTDVAIQHMGRALDTWTGELLPEDGPADWAVGEREMLRSEVTEAATRLAALALEAGDGVAARHAAERGLRLDRFRDELWRSLIEAHRAVGDAAAAMRTEHEYAAMLADLGL